MATCSSGHESASHDFCDVCGFAIGAPVSAGRDPAPAPGALPARCPRCATSRAGRFCETCRYDFSAGGREAPSATRVERLPPGPPAGVAWTAVVNADRAYYDLVRAKEGADTATIAFPVYCPERLFRLSGTEVRVGRRSTRTGIEPEIDLTGPPADPGVSRLHAVLIKAADGSWSVIDPGSANGTLVNGAEIAIDQIVPLADGDRIHLGAWTELKIIRET